MTDILNSLFGGGGDAPDPTAGMQQYLTWLQQQQAAQTQTTAEQTQQGITATNLTQDQLLNRTGYSGEVNVGASTQRSAATLNTEMQGAEGNLADTGTGTTTRGAQYQAALAQQQSDTQTNWRIVSGLQYQAQDAYTTLQQNSAGMSSDDLSAALAAFKQQYNFIDTSDMEAALQAKQAADSTGWTMPQNQQGG